MAVAAAGGHPLHVAVAEPALVSHGIKVVDEPLGGEGDRLIAPMRVEGEPRDDLAAVHAVPEKPVVVHAQATPADLLVGRSLPLVASGIEVVVVGAEDEGVLAVPMHPGVLHAEDRSVPLPAAEYAHGAS